MPRFTRRRALPMVVGLGSGVAGCLSDARAPSDSTGPLDYPPATRRDAVEGRWPSHRYGATGRGYAPGTTGPDSPVGLLWRVDAAVESTTPVIADGTVYVSGEGLVALDAATGAERWTLALDRTFKSSPALHEGLIYVGAGETLVNVDARGSNDATVRWRHRLPSDELTSPVVDDGTVVVASGDSSGQSGAVHAVDADTGSLRWHVSTDAWLGTMPVVASGRVFFGTTGGDLIAVRLDDGAGVWTRTVDGEFFHTFAVADGTVYAPERNGRLYAFDSATGEVRWSTRVAPRTDTNGSVVSSPVAVDDARVYLGARDRMYAFDREDGTEVWNFWAWNAVGSAPAVTGDTVYVGSADTNVYALDAATGTERWAFATGERLWRSTPVIVDGVLYLHGSEHCYAVATRGEGEHD